MQFVPGMSLPIFFVRKKKKKKKIGNQIKFLTKKIKGKANVLVMFDNTEKYVQLAQNTLIVKAPATITTNELLLAPW